MRLAPLFVLLPLLPLLSSCDGGRRDVEADSGGGHGAATAGDPAAGRGANSSGEPAPDAAGAAAGGSAGGGGGVVGSDDPTDGHGAGAGPLTSTPTWQDDFDGPAGSSPDRARWAFDEGGDGWGNQELQHYTARPENASLDGAGHLAITARVESFNKSSYTSARLKTQGIDSFTYGRFEARIRVPTGQGIWPAFWMLGDDIGSAGWPSCGEIDILENIGREPATLHATLHGPGYSGGSGLTQTLTLPEPLSASFHVYAIEWEPDRIRWYFDDQLYSTKTPADLPAGAPWVFDHPFFLILNVAVGGTWPGDPDGTSTFPQTMLVDYVRVYQK